MGKDNREHKYVTLITVFILAINAIIVYFGRIYYPENFLPETTSYFENYWVLTLGMCFVVSIISVFGAIFWFFSRELYRDIKSLFNKNK